MKKIAILLISCLISFFISAQQNEIIVLQENFPDNYNRWDLYSDKDGSVSMTDGKLIIENTTYTTLATGINVYLDTLHDFSITAFASLITSHLMDGYGLFFGAKDVNNGYYFLIGSNDKGGAWRVTKYEDGKEMPFTKWAANSAIKPGKNINNALSVKQENGNWIFYINDQQAGTIKAQHFFGNKVGFDVDNIQKVAFSNLTVANNYNRISSIGKLCEILPAINEQSKTNFYHINTGKIAEEQYGRRTRVAKANGQVKYEPSITITDAEFNYIGFSDGSYEYISRAGSYGKPEDAIKKSDSLSKQLSACLKNFIITKLPGKSGELPVYRITEKINGGYKSGENFIRIAKDSSLRMSRYFVNIVISNVRGKSLTLITNKSDNSKLAVQLKQLRGYSAKKFKDILGEFIPGSNAIGTWNREYNTSYKVENAKRNYIRTIGDEKDAIIPTYFYAVFGENMIEKDGTALFNNMFEKLKKALGSEMVYSVMEDWTKGVAAEYKLITFVNKQDDKHYVYDLKIEREKGKYKVEIAVY